MTGLVVECRGSCAMARCRRSKPIVLVAVVAGLLFGAIACAASLSVGHAHAGPATATNPAASSPSDGHAAHRGGPVQVDADPSARSLPTHGAGRAGHSGDVSTTGSHPGMACVVSVDLRFPQPSSASVSESCVTIAAGMTTEWSADVDPPIPRSS